MTAGQTIHVQAPDGRLNAIIVPPGFGPGSTFTVEFASEEAAPPKTSHPSPSAPAAPATGGDDGFASGFNNPGWTPPATAVSASEPEVHVSAYDEGNGSSTAYPTTSATPLYTPSKY